MKVNVDKSVIMVNGLSKEVSNELIGSLTFKKSVLDDGIKYLGFIFK
jgi:hypothetical protein